MASQLADVRVGLGCSFLDLKEKDRDQKGNTAFTDASAGPGTVDNLPAASCAVGVLTSPEGSDLQVSVVFLPRTIVSERFFLKR